MGNRRVRGAVQEHGNVLRPHPRLPGAEITMDGEEQGNHAPTDHLKLWAVRNEDDVLFRAAENGLAVPEGPYKWDEVGGPARTEQRWPDGDWRVWLILAGRGFGKTRTGAETVRRVVRERGVSRIALVGETAADVRDVMIEGPDGLLRRCHPSEQPKYEPSKRRLTWPNGVVATAYAGADPEQLRGPQHGFAWVDELAKFKYPTETWDNLMFGLRMGNEPRCLVTTTPRPIRLLRELLAPNRADVRVTRGSTYDNAKNLPQAFLNDILRKYEDTTVGRQELYAELLDETPGALWKRKDLDRCRATEVPKLNRVVIAVDPSVRNDGNGAACGIVVAGIDDRKDPCAWVLEDATLNASPKGWADEVARLYRKHNANQIVAESNQGGGLIKSVLQAADWQMPVGLVNAKHSKAARAEPVAALYEVDRVRHAGSFPDLEDEMVNWLPGKPSPNRLDALVWAITALLLAQVGGEVQAELFG